MCPDLNNPHQKVLLSNYRELTLPKLRQLTLPAATREILGLDPAILSDGPRRPGSRSSLYCFTIRYRQSDSPTGIPHSANYGIKLAEHLKTLGVECELNYPGAPGIKHTDMFAYLMEKLHVTVPSKL